MYTTRCNNLPNGRDRLSPAVRPSRRRPNPVNLINPVKTPFHVFPLIGRLTVRSAHFIDRKISNPLISRFFPPFPGQKFFLPYSQPNSRPFASTWPGFEAGSLFHVSGPSFRRFYTFFTYVSPLILFPSVSAVPSRVRAIYLIIIRYLSDNVNAFSPPKYTDAQHLRRIFWRPASNELSHNHRRIPTQLNGTFTPVGLVRFSIRSRVRWFGRSGSGCGFG
jgi:hypothetical protein